MDKFDVTNMKKFLIIACVILMTGCTPRADQYTPEVLPDGLQDCSFFNMRDSDGEYYRVVRCPLSTTTTNYNSGKTSTSVTVVDEKTKEQVAEEIALSKLSDDDKKALGL